jgi:hypothetical protein
MSNVYNFEYYRFQKIEKTLKYDPIIDIVKINLSEEDFRDFLEGANDYDYYVGLDKEIQEIIETYWENTAN